MINTEFFGGLLRDRGFNFYSGVPCSFLKDLINYSINECEYVMAANEGDAAAICAGAYLGGRKSVLLMQNSGLGNAVSPLTSLHAIFGIPLLGFVSLRGERGMADEPQHELMGPITIPMLKTMGMACEILADTNGAVEAQLVRAEKRFAAGKPFFFIVKRGTFSKVVLKNGKAPPGPGKSPSPEGLFKRGEMLKSLKAAAAPGSVFLATTGFTGRELYELGDDPGNLYLAGSLGCVSSLGLGLALARPDRRIIVLDGDGSLLIRAGSLAVNAWYGPASLLHVLLDNRAHESTGGQFTVSTGVDWPAAAKAFGYPAAGRAETPGALAEEISAWNREGGLRFVHVPIAMGAPENLGRPGIKPPAVTARLKEYLLHPGA
jgi:phosphonopyruvate decarboxylase